jgi:membrane protein YdbS with pleckstrin-like domain
MEPLSIELSRPSAKLLVDLFRTLDLREGSPCGCVMNRPGGLALNVQRPPVGDDAVENLLDDLGLCDDLLLGAGGRDDGVVLSGGAVPRLRQHHECAQLLQCPVSVHDQQSCHRRQASGRYMRPRNLLTFMHNSRLSRGDGVVFLAERIACQDTHMTLSRKHLSDDEEVVYHLRTHLKAVFVPILVLIVALAAASVGMVAVDSDVPRWGIVAVALVVVAVWGIWPILNWLASTYTITNQRLITRSGVFTRTGRDIPHEHIHDVAYEQSVLDRLLRCGTLVVSSASEQGTVRLHDVPGVHAVQLRLSELVRESDDEVARPTEADQRP